MDGNTLAFTQKKEAVTIRVPMSLDSADTVVVLDLK